MTNGFPVGLTLLSSMITPAVLISACGTLIFSTATRLARIVDRVRELSHGMEDSEMEFTLRLGALYQERHGLKPGAYTAEEEPNPWERLRRLFEREVGGRGGEKR